MKHIDSTIRLNNLRLEMKQRSLDAFILTMEDSHFSEYTSSADKRIAFISGFTGSAGTAVISTNSAALWTDGRYHNQASHELDNNWIMFREGTPDVTTLPQWLVQSTPPSAKIGFDPQQVPFISVESFIRDLAKAEASSALDSSPTNELKSKNVSNSPKRAIIPVPGENLVDLIWEAMGKTVDSHCQRPARPCNPISLVSVSFAGVPWQEKLGEVRARMKKVNCDATILFSLEEIAWLLNLRGTDIPHNPVFYAYAVVTSDQLILFLHTARGADSVDLGTYLNSTTHTVEIRNYSEFGSWLNSPGGKNVLAENRVWLSPTSSYAIVSAIENEFRYVKISPVSSMKSVKNLAELTGMRDANLIDSLALCDFLAWLDDVSNSVTADSSLQPSTCIPCDCKIAPPTLLNEATVGNYLDAIRTSSVGCVGLSFPTISAVDANAAIIHYHTTDDENSTILSGDSLYLVDSGGQYSMGTTDVTRTVHLGIPSSSIVEDYTLVLKAHINLATQFFPDNTVGTNLDVVCRSALWRSQRDFMHGTGHGVGAYLCVHEGPIGLSGRRSVELFRLGIKEPGLHEGMIVTIEPGYYLSGKYGIRLENVNAVVKAPVLTLNTVPFLAFEPLTLVPFQHKLIQVDLLSKEEIIWLNRYHDQVRVELEKLIMTGHDDIDQLTPSRRRTRDWIIRETAPINYANS